MAWYRLGGMIRVGHKGYIGHMRPGLRALRADGSIDQNGGRSS